MKVKDKKNSNKNISKSILFSNLSNTYIFIIISVVISIVYISALKFDFTNFDDSSIIPPNAELFSDIDNINKVVLNDAFFQNGTTSFFRPLQNLSFMIDYQFSEINPVAYHITNILLHICSTIFLFLLLIELNFEKRISFISSLIFAVAPVFNQAIAWVPGRGDLFLGLSSIIFLYTFLKFDKSNNQKFLIIHLISLAIALLSKESALVLPFIVLSYIILLKRSEIFKKQNVILYIVYIILSLLYLFLRSYVMIAKTDSSSFGIAQLFSNFQVLFEIIAKFFLPISLSTLSIFSILNTVLGLIIITLIVFLTLKIENDKRLIIFASLWYIAFSIPGMMYSNYLGINAYDYLEHRAYLPAVGLIIIFSSLFNYFTKKNNLLIIYSVILLLFYIVLNFMNISYYKNDLSYYGRAVENNPNTAALAYLNIGLAKANMGNHKEAIELFSKAAEIKPDYSDAYSNRALSNTFLGIYNGEILKDYDKAISINPNKANFFSNRAIAKSKMNDKEGAINDYIQSLKIDPKFQISLNNLAYEYNQMGKFNESIEVSNNAIKYYPKYANAYLNRAISNYQLNDIISACNDWKTAYELGSAIAKDFLEKYCK